MTKPIEPVPELDGYGWECEMGPARVVDWVGRALQTLHRHWPSHLGEVTTGRKIDGPKHFVG